jgi:hypothetical protein
MSVEASRGDSDRVRMTREVAVGGVIVLKLSGLYLLALASVAR